MIPGCYVANPQSNVLFLRDLPPHVSEEDLVAVFSQQIGYVDLTLVQGTWYINFHDIFCAMKTLHEILVPGFDIKNYISKGLKDTH